MTRYRWRQNGLAGNLFVGESFTKIALAAPGLPYVPGAQEYFQDLLESGYAIVQPQYVGTYDSDGSFSPRSAIETIGLVAAELKRGIFDAKSQRIIVSGQFDLVVAHSFGTWVIINSSHFLKGCRQVVLLSPFLAMGAHKTNMGISADLSEQVDYIERALPMTFRLSSRLEWSSFFGDGDFPPPSKSFFAKSNIVCVVGSNDNAFDVALLSRMIRSHFVSIAAHLSVHVVAGVGHDATGLFRGAKVMEVLRAREGKKNSQEETK